MKKILIAAALCCGFTTNAAYADYADYPFELWAWLVSGGPSYYLPFYEPLPLPSTGGTTPVPRPK